MKCIKVFKHRLYYYDEKREMDVAIDEAETWEEALILYQNHSLWNDVKIVSKHFDQAVF